MSTATTPNPQAARKRTTNSLELERLSNSVKLEIEPKVRSIGPFDVRRTLPSAGCRSVGPFVFLDQMGPIMLPANGAMDVPPHPHIGLATLTWLVEGEILHRDSLGFEQLIRPGEVNWMTAGRGIVHSERTPDHLRGNPSPMFGLQCWLALPVAHEEMEPEFFHLDAGEMPSKTSDGATMVVVAGEAWGLVSPVRVFGSPFFAEITLEAGAVITVPAEIEERAICILQGQIDIGGDPYGTQRLLVLDPGAEVAVTALETSRIAVLGGAPLDGRRHMYWNFVSSSRERIEQAKSEWRARRFPLVPGDEDEFVPLPA